MLVLPICIGLVVAHTSNAAVYAGSLAAFERGEADLTIFPVVPAYDVFGKAQMTARSPFWRSSAACQKTNSRERYAVRMHPELIDGMWPYFF